MLHLLAKPFRFYMDTVQPFIMLQTEKSPPAYAGGDNFFHLDRSVAVEGHPAVIRVIQEAAIRRVGDVTCRIVGIRLVGEHHVAHISDHSASHPTEVIISITHLGRFCKYLL